MMKNIFKKTLALVLVLAITFTFAFTINRHKGFDEHSNLVQLNAFTNDKFNTEIPSSSNAEEFIKFSEIHEIILNAMTSTTHGTGDARDTYMSNAITSLVGNKRVGIYTADDLYNFSIAASYNWREAATPNLYANLKTIKVIMDLDYALVSDIDYSTMKSKQFIPVGINIDLSDGTGGSSKTYLPFTGTFDGNGFAISNLYLADYNYITMIYRMAGDEEGSTDADIPLSNYYAMFANVGTSAVIKNFQIINPILELLDVPDGLTKAAVLAGENNGIIENVAVIDAKTNAAGNDSSGIMWSLPYGAVQTTTFTAAGLVHTNNGTLQNSYYSADRVVYSSSDYLFETKPVVYTEGGTITGIAYDKVVEQYIDENNESSNIIGYTESELLNGNGVNINSATLADNSRSWHFFEYDCLPTLQGLDFNSSENAFVIADEYDLIIFSQILSRQTPYNGIAYTNHNYVITKDIDMRNLPYTPPKEEFKGSLVGGTGTLEDTINSNKVIKNLSITNPYNTETEMYYGLFSKLSGTVSNINFDNCTINLLQDDSVVTKTSYVGFVAGVSNGATISNIITNSTIGFGTLGVGKTYAGGIVGYGNGNISYVANTGNINGNADHSFTGLTLNAIYQIGGILGGSSENNLTLTNSINTGQISSPGTLSTFTSSSNIQISVGGIVGQLNNSTSTNNVVYYVTNEGQITANKFAGTNTKYAYIYCAGVIGNVIGKSGPLNNGEQVLNGRYENKGLIKNFYTNDYTYCYNAGILVASTSEYSEFSYMINTANNNLYSELGMTNDTNNKEIYYAATVVDNSTAGVTLSRAYNEADYVYPNTYFDTNSQEEALIGPFFTSVSDYKSKLLYCQNSGDITVSDITTSTDTKIAGFTQSYNIDYQNVYMTGDIKVLNVNQSADLYVAGISWILPYLTTVNIAKNCLNEGQIITAGISGNTTIVNNQKEYEVSNWWGGTTTETAYGTDQEAPGFSATIDANNLYVAGLFNLNVGELTNSMNRGDISSEYSGYNQITGTCNTFVGGLVTYNYNLIQDCANSGNINYSNETESPTEQEHTGYLTYVAGGNDPNCHFGGLIYAYSAGLALGGICSALGDRQATILNGKLNYGYLSDTSTSSMAKIYDSSNNGNVYGKAQQYVRCGGILAVALGVEITAGNDSIDSEESGAKRFSYCEVGSGDRIATSELSNGLNFGNICAVTNKIGQYSGTDSTRYGNEHSYNNAKRPGIYSCSGGVIGYGLCKMVRMINHGVISSCDVAGGVVGATYVLGSVNPDEEYSVTTVDINTAVHYGKVKAIRNESYYDFDSLINSNFDENDTEHFYPDGDTTFIFPLNSSAGLTFENLSLYPNKKRGFGGVFGRLQRGNSGVMNSNSFINILNMDPNVDMIGRADGTSYGAYYYYKLFVEGRKDTYFSARINDTTPALIVGYISSYSSSKIAYASNSGNSSVTYTIRRGNNNRTFTIVSVQYNNVNINTVEEKVREVSGYDATSPLTNAQSSETQQIISNVVSVESNVSGTMTLNDTNYQNYGFTQAELRQLLTQNNTTTTVDRDIPSDGLVLSVDENEYDDAGYYKMEIVTDNPSETDYTYIFDEDFPLMDPEQSNYIYAADNPVLANRFRLNTSTNYKPNGMYVLASTKGRDKGAVLPANLKISSLYKLNEAEGKYIDLNNISTDDVIHDEEHNKELLNDYQSMFQIRLSDKSAIMEQSTNDTLYDIVLYDPTGKAPTLTNGVKGVDSSGKPTITFTISSDAFNLTGNSTTVNYKVLSAELSENAVIAKSGITESNHPAFLVAYNNRTSNIISGSFESTITGTVTAGQSLELSDKVTVYSEIACNVSSLITTYYSDYTIIINCVDTRLNITMNSATMDGANVNVPTLDGTTYNFGTTSSILPNGTLGLVFRDVNNILPDNHELTFVGLKYNGTTIDPKYYSYDLSGVNNDNLFGIDLSLSDELASGTYTLEYKYYSNKDSYYVTFNKSSSNEYSVLDVNYDSYSFTSDAADLEFLTQSVNFDTYIGFGVLLKGVSYNTNSALTVRTINKTGVESYVNNVDYYELYLNDVLINTVKLSPFATLSSATVSYRYDADGNREHVFTYNILDESGTSHPITHTIKERALDDVVIYKNGVVQLSQPITVLRESVLTQVSIDFGFADATENKNVTTVITGNSNAIDETMVYYSTAAYYVVNITDLLETGELIYTFNLQRETDVQKELTSIQIEKLKGTSAYLQDINFQAGSDSNLVYPTIYESNANGEEITSLYDIRVYYAGIDYDGADENGIEYFRIDGKVADIDIENYHPTFTIPVGATIERYDSASGTWTTDLYANFIGEDENKDCIILYRITSEDGLSTVYYHITTTDILYNLTLRFTIYYRDGNGNIMLADDANSPIKNSTVVITVRNYVLKQSIDAYTKNIEGNHTTYPLEPTTDNPTGITGEINGVNNQTTLFYRPHSLSDYLYTFGRNLSGCYGFSIVSPIYNGTTGGKLVNGERYTYDIYFKGVADGTGGVQYPWETDDYILPNLDDTGVYDGKYFFIENSLRNRIRNFAIVINAETGDGDWGLTDDTTTWN